MSRSVTSIGGEDSSNPASPTPPCSPLNAIPVYSFSPRHISSTSLSQANTNLPDYDDLPSDHKPILPPKTGNQSVSHLNALDPVQLQLHNQIMSRSVGNIPSKQSTPSSYYTLQTKKHGQDSLEINTTTPSTKQNRVEDESIPIPMKTSSKKTAMMGNGNIIENNKKRNSEREFEDYDQPVVKHRTNNHKQEEYQDYDEPTINHPAAGVSGRTEFEDYDEPLNHTRNSAKHQRILNTSSIT